LGALLQVHLELDERLEGGRAHANRGVGVPIISRAWQAIDGRAGNRPDIKMAVAPFDRRRAPHFRSIRILEVVNDTATPIEGEHYAVTDRFWGREHRGRQSHDHLPQESASLKVFDVLNTRGA
jgi:hypothetical protein